MGKELLIAKDLKQYFPIGKDRFVRAVDGVNFSINEGEVMGLVGESGSGKSTIAYTVMGMYRQTDGEIIFNGQTITNKTKGRSKDFRRDAQIVFQDPGSSLNPYQDVRQILSLPLRVHNVVPKDGIDDKIREILHDGRAATGVHVQDTELHRRRRASAGIDCQSSLQQSEIYYFG